MRRIWLIWTCLTIALLCAPSAALAYEFEGDDPPSRDRGRSRLTLAACQFQLGFRQLRDQIPSVVGTCLENERRDLPSVNVVQATTRGLLVYRPADSSVQFTDGRTTWVHGPSGVQSRPNDRRFTWESGATLPPQLWPAWDLLLSTPAPEGSGLVSFGGYAQRWLAQSQVRVSVAPLASAWASYSSRSGSIVIAPDVAYDIPEAAAAVLMHELRHAAQQEEGYTDCVQSEVEALFWEAITWQRLTGGGVSDPQTWLQSQENELLELAIAEGEEGVRRLVRSDPGYRQQCDI